MEPLKNAPSKLKREVVRAYESLTEGWRELLKRSNGALTHFEVSAKRKGEAGATQDLPNWSLLAAETWETAQSVIVRVEIPGMRKEDFDISVGGNLLRIRGEKRFWGEHLGSLNRLTERAYGRFERSVPLPHTIDEDVFEVSYRDGVVTVILRKTETIPPR